MLSFQQIPKTYPELLAMHAPRPLHSDADMQQVVAICMAMAGHQLNTDQDDYLELLAILIDDYETKKEQG